ncbi:MAG: helix-turn-helix transcriptional regulator [Erysipelotrichaceae bacterium]|nr:helix-turn-helix transcriptional regulator [Erysipelotrichaceae bacterium]
MKKHHANTGEISEYTNPEIPYYIIRTWGKHSYDINTFHWHQDFEFDLVLNGQIRVVFNDQTIVIEAGNGIFINSHTMHALVNDEADYICVRFHPMLLSANSYVERTYVSPIASNPDYPYVFLDQNVQWKKDILDSIQQVYMFSSAGVEDMSLLATGALFFTWHQIYTNLPMMDTGKESSKMSSVKAMIGFIQNSFGEEISLQDIADAANISVSSASTLFREIIHDSPYHYLLTFRLEQARIMLGSTDLPVSEIAMKCGLNDVSHFIRSFRSTYGQTPLQYRKTAENA